MKKLIFSIFSLAFVFVLVAATVPVPEYVGKFIGDGSGLTNITAQVALPSYVLTNASAFLAATNGNGAGLTNVPNLSVNALNLGHHVLTNVDLQLDFGATGAAILLNNVYTTNGYSQIYCATANWTFANDGQPIRIAQAGVGGVDLSTTIYSVQNATHCTLNANASVTGNAPAIYGPDDTASVTNAWNFCCLSNWPFMPSLYCPPGNYMIAGPIVDPGSWTNHHNAQLIFPSVPVFGGATLPKFKMFGPPTGQSGATTTSNSWTASGATFWCGLSDGGSQSNGTGPKIFTGSMVSCANFISPYFYPVATGSNWYAPNGIDFEMDNINWRPPVNANMVALDFRDLGGLHCDGGFWGVGYDDYFEPATTYPNSAIVALPGISVCSGNAVVMRNIHIEGSYNGAVQGEHADCDDWYFSNCKMAITAWDGGGYPATWRRPVLANSSWLFFANNLAANATINIDDARIENTTGVGTGANYPQQGLVTNLNSFSGASQGNVSYHLGAIGSATVPLVMAGAPAVRATYEQATPSVYTGMVYNADVEYNNPTYNTAGFISPLIAAVDGNFASGIWVANPTSGVDPFYGWSQGWNGTRSGQLLEERCGYSGVNYLNWYADAYTNNGNNVVNIWSYLSSGNTFSFIDPNVVIEQSLNVYGTITGNGSGLVGIPTGAVSTNGGYNGWFLGQSNNITCWTLDAGALTNLNASQVTGTFSATVLDSITNTINVVYSNACYSISNLYASLGGNNVFNGANTFNGSTAFNSVLSFGAGVYLPAANLTGTVPASALPQATIINTFTNNVTNILSSAGVLIKTNATYNLYLVANGTTNTVVGDGIWIDVAVSGTNFYTRY